MKEYQVMKKLTKRHVKQPQTHSATAEARTYPPSLEMTPYPAASQCSNEPTRNSPKTDGHEHGRNSPDTK
jgi:hypothetical protein